MRTKILSYKDLSDKSIQVRAEMFKRYGTIPGKDKIRKKPRNKDKSNVLLLMAKNKLKKYPPEVKPDGTIVLPYFSR
ncbi:MAG: hypothetical protein DDT19_01798 [Syntrophomonadaceae bacterium]|nr:hypothetical protein [Bacillota bacterium]